MSEAEILIRAFEPADQSAARDLILAGMQEHWGTLDPTLNPDLRDIASSYANALYLVAYQGDRLVGTGALKPRPGGVREVVRMSVAADLRRQGLGGHILRQLLAAACQAGAARVILETTETWDEVIAFYLRHGFRVTHHLDGDVYFEMTL